MSLIDPVLRGVVIVALVSLNTKLLAVGHPAAVLVAPALSGVWWINARSASRATGAAAGLAYALGAGTGTAIGLAIGAAF